MAHVLRHVLAVATEREGGPPERVVLTHPASYGPYRLDMMREVARLADVAVDRVDLISEPQAAAISYAARNRVDTGQVVVVYDFGGGTFDVALVRRTATGFDLVGTPDGLDRFGGIDIDAAVLAHVDAVLDGAVSSLDALDGEVQRTVALLLDQCRNAKEALSSDTMRPSRWTCRQTRTQVRITRAELESMIRPRLQETFDALQRTVRGAGLTMDQIDRVPLVGGSSRVPLVGEFVHAATGRPIALDADPKLQSPPAPRRCRRDHPRVLLHLYPHLRLRLRSLLSQLRRRASGGAAGHQVC